MVCCIAIVTGKGLKRDRDRIAMGGLGDLGRNLAFKLVPQIMALLLKPEMSAI